MRNKDFPAHLQTWADLHDLRPSTRSACGHGVLGRGAKSDAHDHWCVGWRSDLIDHATLWVRDGARLLVAFTYRPRPGEPGHENYVYRVDKYAERLGITAYMPSLKNRLHELYATDTCVVLYGAKGVDLQPFSEGIRRSWVPKPEPFFPRDESKRARRIAADRARAAGRRAEL
jgi:hypothetical protein